MDGVRGQLGIDDVVDALNDTASHLIDAVLIEADDDRRHRGIL